MVRFVALMLVAGCGSSAAGPPDAAADGAPCGLGVAIGSKDGDAFAAYDDGDSAEIVLGFQGFLFLLLSLRVEGTDADTAEVSARAEVEGLSPSWTRSTKPLHADGDARYANDVQIFFNTSSLAELLGKETLLSASVQIDGCAATEERRVVLVDAQGCVAQPDGGLACVDAGSL